VSVIANRFLGRAKLPMGHKNRLVSRSFDPLERVTQIGPTGSRITVRNQDSRAVVTAAGMIRLTEDVCAWAG